MPDFKVRRRIAAQGGISLGDGKGRVSKDLWLPATAFTVASAVSGSIGEEHEGGSMISASLNVDVSGSIFADTDTASLGFAVIQPHTDVSGSPTYAQTVFPVPTDADTSGSVQARALWTVHDEHATTGSVFAILGGMTYISSSATARTAASTGACPAYNYTASGNFYETSLGDLPSFGANDVAAAFILLHDQSDSADTGGSGISFLGVKLRYVANSLGASQS